MKRTIWISAILFALAGFTPAPAQALLISEFLTSNDGGLRDADGETADWIEIYNPTTEGVDLDGWYLTNDEENLSQWRFPSVVIEASGYLLVFASGKDRRGNGSELHTNFKLSSEGEYLALVAPDGATVIHEYAPAYPPQEVGISYGIGQDREVITLVAGGSEARILVPSDDTLGAHWTGGEEPFDDSVASGWRRGLMPAGYDTDEDVSLLAYWPLDDTVEDLAGDSDGTLVGASFSADVAAAVGSTNSLDFDGSGDHVDLSSHVATFAGLSEGTFSAWIKTTSAGTHVIVSASDQSRASSEIRFFMESGGKVKLGVRADGNIFLAESVSTFSDGTWHHVAAVVSAAGNVLYADGEQIDVTYAYGDATSPAFFDDVPGLDTMAIGRNVDSGGPQWFFDGHIDDVAIFDEPLSSGEVGLLAGGIPPSLVRRLEIETDLQAEMINTASSAYLRIPFVVDDVQSPDALTLRMKYDDGFVAYINGLVVASRNAPALLRYDSVATRAREEALADVFEEIPISQAISRLVTGENILAVHGLNVSAFSTDFLVSAELDGAWIDDLEEGYFKEPTPAASNGITHAGIVSDTSFSVDRGFFRAAFEVEITTLTPDAVIRYTTDGTAPTESNGTVYKGPVPISTTTTLRAAAFKPDFLPTNVDTQTYIFLDHVTQQPASPPGFPLEWYDHADCGAPPGGGKCDSDYEMDPGVVDDPHYSSRIKDSLRSLPTLSIVMDPYDLFDLDTGIYANPLERGVEWERPSSVELFYADGRQGFQIDAGLRSQGGASRRPWTTPKHPFRLFFKAEYGAAKLEYPWFGLDATDSFDTVVLRAGFNDAWTIRSSTQRLTALYVRDQFVRDSQREMGQPSSDGAFVHLYVNGLYWGIYNPSERPDEDFMATYFGGEDDEYDVLSHKSGELVAGDRVAWNAMFGIASGGLGSAAAYDTVREYLDVQSLADYMILNFYTGTLDWPQNNWYMARRRAPGEGFKCFIWDAEQSLKSVTENRTGVNTSNSPAYLYDRCRENAEFRLLFADRVHRFFFHDGALTPLRVQARFEALLDEVELAIIGESARWGDYWREPPYTLEVEWKNEKRRLLTSYFPQRTATVLNQFRSAGLYPSLEAPEFNQHGGAIEPDFTLQMSAPAGVVYYTLDGTDPRLEGGAVSPAAQAWGEAQAVTLIGNRSDVRALVPADGSLGLDWTTVDFDDGAWIAGNTGVGYERSSGFEDLISLNVETQMHGVNASIYLRIPFDVDDPADFTTLTLLMKYDDGFVAYLNGARVAERNAPEPLSWDEGATRSRPDSEAVVFEVVELSDGVALLQAGRNVLALHGLNAGAGSSDFLILPELLARGGETGGGVSLDRTTRVKARAWQGGTWSALNEASFVVDSTGLRITEVMYNPPALPGAGFNDEEYEYIELRNVSGRALNLAGIRISGGVNFTFPELTPEADLQPGEFVLVVENREAFFSRYDARSLYVAGVYSGRLANGGDLLVLSDAASRVILEFAYDDGWYDETDGLGRSLEIVDARAPLDSWSDPSSWRASAEVLGSPGRGDPLAPPGEGQLPGDLNQDASVDLSDAISMLLYLFMGRPEVLPCDGGMIADEGNRLLFDVSGDGEADLTDAVYLLDYVFKGGSPPALGTRCTKIPGCPDACAGS